MRTSLLHSVVVLCIAAYALNLTCGCGSAGAALASSQREDDDAKGRIVTEVSRSCLYVLQARSGDTWFGSDKEGVFRYDGKTIINFTTADGLAANSVRGIQEDNSGNIFILTFRGISKFDGKKFRTLPVSKTPQDGGWRLNRDDLWFQWFRGMPTAPGSPDTEGPYRYDGTNLYQLQLPKSEQDTTPRAETSKLPYSPYDVYSIYRDSRGHMWIGTGSLGACRYDGKSFGWLFERHLVFVPGGGMFGTRSIIEDKDGAFWICNTKQKFRVEPENTGNTIKYTREAGIEEKLTGEVVYFQGAVKDASGDLWFSPYGGGIWRWNGKSVTNYPVKDAGSDTQVFSIFGDQSGRFWLGTPTAGPFRFDGDTFVQFGR